MGHFISILVYGGLVILHGDLDQRIASLTADIALYPDSVSLYQTRGELHLLHEDHDAALHDFTFCLEHHLVSADVYLGLSKSYISSVDSDSAIYFVDLALLSEPGMYGALEWKARLLLLKQMPCDAARAYDQLLSLAADPSPSLFIDASATWFVCGDHEGKRRAIEVLLNGLDRLGSIQVIQKELVIQYQQQEKYQEALLIQNDIVDQASHKSKPLMTRAAIHRAMGEINAAKQDLQQALLFLDQTPAHRSGTPAMMALRNNILSLLDELDR